MSKGKSTWKYNKLLTARRNYYGLGGLGTSAATSKPVTEFVDKITNKHSGGGEMGLAGAIGQIGVQAASDISNMIDNIRGENITDRANQLISSVNSNQMGAQSASDTFDQLASDAMNTSQIQHTTSKKLGAENGLQIGSGAFVAGNQGFAAGSGLGLIGAAAAATGSTVTSLIGSLFRNKNARKAANRVNSNIDYTNLFNERSINNRAENLADSQMFDLLSNYAAFGGELNTQGGDFTNGLLSINNGGSHESNPYEGVLMGIDPEGTPNLVEEGETVFNDYVFSKRLKVPKAVRDKYKLRGTKDLTFADVSKEMAKESEERPNDPISLRGLEAFMADLANAQEGVREKKQSNAFALGGKVNKFDDGSRIRNVSNLADVSESDGWVSITYQMLKKKLQDLAAMPEGAEKEASIQTFMDQANQIQESYRDNILQSGVSWNGQALKGAGLEHQTLYSNYGFDTPLDYIMKDANGRDYTIDEVLSLPAGGQKDNIIGNHTLLKNLGINRDQRLKKYYDELAQLASNIGVNYAPNREGDLMYYFNKAANTDTKASQVNTDVTPVGNTTNDTQSTAKSTVTAPKYTSTDEGYTPGKYADWLRYAPVVGYGIGTIASIFDKPDYSNANSILDAVKGASAYQPVKFNPIGNYLTYKPFDRDYYINKMNAEAGASRRAIANTSGGNRATAMAGILAADNNYLNQIGGLARQAEEYNLAQRQQVEEFNRGTNTTNSQGMLQADIANQKALMDSSQFALKGITAAAQMREAAKLRRDQTRSDNISGLFKALGDIGYDEANRKMTDILISTGALGEGADRFSSKGKRISTNTRGTRRVTNMPNVTPELPIFASTPNNISLDLEQANKWEAQRKALRVGRYLRFEKGGKLNKKKKKGLTL